MKKLLFASLGATALLAGCGDKDGNNLPANYIAGNGYESMEGWAPSATSITTEKAHSGRFSVKVDKDNEFGAGYINLLGKVSPTRVQKLTIKGWAFRTGADAKAAVVVSIVNPANPSQKVFWESLDLTTEVKTFNRWTEVSKTFTFPASVAPTYQLYVYLWRNGGSQPVYLDDVELLRE